MTSAMSQLIADAKRSGYRVDISHDGIRIYKFVGRWKHEKGLWIWPDGTAIRIDVDPSIAAGIRSYLGMRAALGIESKRREQCE